MSLSDDLVSRFAKITKDNNGKHESTVYGTVVSRNDKLYVNIDGSDTITPIVSAAEIKAGERVTVLIKDHTATVLGNISNPSASTESVGKILDDYDVVIAKIGQFELVIADKVDTEYLNAQVAVINDLIAGKASIGELNAVKATIKDLDVSKLEADVANINQALINKAEIVDLEAVIADINQLNADFADITILVAEKAAISDLNALKATIADLNVGQLRADVADINKAVINKAEITDLNAANAEINALKTNVANINTLVGGNLTMDNIQSLVLSSSKVTVDNAFIKDAMIDSVNASKVNAGVIDTNKVSIQSADGSMVLQGTLQQFKDASGKVRIQIGKDAKGDFTFVLYGADGKGQLINQNGITASAISDGLIVNSMVSDNANIAGSKLDINSVVTEINNGTTTIKGSKVFLDEKNQTFDVVFNKLSSTVDEVDKKVTSQSTQISTAQGKIQTLISNTTITKEDGKTVSLKDDYSSFKQTVDGINSKVGSLETTVDNNNKTVTSKVSSLEQSLNGVSSELSSVKTTVSNNKQSTDSQLSSFQQSLNGISSNVSSLQKTVDNNNKTITSKVATLETSLDGITQRVSSTESTTTTLTTKVDKAQSTANSAVSKADTAQSTANTANGKIDNLKTEYQTTKSKVSSLETNLNGITSRVSATETNVEKIRNASTQNLLYNSDFRIVKNGLPDGWSVADTTKITFDPNNTLLDGIPSFCFNITGLTEDKCYAVFSPFIDTKPGEKFVASVYVYTKNNWSALDQDCRIEIEFYDDSGRIAVNKASINKSKTGWQRLVVKSTAPAGTTKVRMRVHPTRNGQFNMSKPMLQYGETVTGWDKGFDIQNLTTRLSTAESKITEDAITNTVKKNFYTKTETEGAITSKGYQTASQVKQTTDAIKSEVSSLKTTVNNNKQSVDSQFSTFQQTVDGIKGEVNSVKTTVNNNKTNVDSKMATFQQSLNGFSSEVSSVKTTVNNIQIGGRNLVINSDVLNSAFSPVENYKGTRTVVEDTAAKSKKHLEFKCTTAGIGFHTPIFKKSSDKIGKTYTWSLWAKCSVNKSGTVGHESGGQRTINLTTEWQKFTHTWVFTDAQNSSFTWYIQWKVDEILYVRDFKIEEGNKATDWTPAPEDVSAAINTVDKRASSIKQTVDGIDLEVKKKVNGDSIISAINMSPESIKISASKVSISGFVTFSDLSTSGSTTINGANITTGYISGDRIKGGKITATREINFEGGARIFGNTGESNAGLTISAAGFTLGGGAVNYLNGSWYISDDMGVDGLITSNNNSVRFGKQINVSGNITGTSFTCNGPCALNDNVSVSGTAWLNGVNISGSTTAKGLSCSSIKTSGNVEVSGHFLANGNIYGMNNIALSRGSLYAPVGSATRDHLKFGSHILSSDPSYGVLLTDSAGEWTKVRCGTVIANGTTLSSDKRLKTDIKYINLDAQTIGENGLEAPNVNITTEDMHTFIETLPIASYRLKSDIKADLDKTYYGFIAQDILYSKVGSELIEYDVIELEPPVIDEEGNITKDGVYDDKGLRYSENKFITFICGALQEEIRQRKALERQLNELMDTINK